MKRMKMKTLFCFHNKYSPGETIRWYYNRYLYLILMFVCCVIAEFTSFVTMYTTSMLYQTLSEGRRDKFLQYLMISFLCITVQSGVIASKKYTRDQCGLRWREIIVKVLHQHLKNMSEDNRHLFSTLFTATSSTSSNPFPSINKELPSYSYPVILTNIDQRITIDVENFCDLSVLVLEKILIVPFVILFYSFWLGFTIDWYAPLLCLLYFLVGSFLCHRLSQRLVPLGYLQSQYEGNFRYHHLHFLQHLEQILLLQGGSCELLALSRRLQEVLSNKVSLLRKEFFLNYCMNWFDYSGTSICYLIVGIAILSHPSDSSSSDRIVRWSRGVFAAMTLISSFSAIFDSSQNYALALAAKQRIEEFMIKLPLSDSLSQSKKKKKEEEEEEEGSEGSSLLSSLSSSSSREVSALAGIEFSALRSSSTCPICSSSLPQSASPSGLFLSLSSIDLYSKDHKKLLVKGLSLQCFWQMRLLITGPTGSGKSTLLKVILQQLQSCQPSLPVLFVPQSPYFLHQGSLWDNLHYPLSGQSLHRTEKEQSVDWKERHYQKAKRLLQTCQLSSYLSQLDLSVSDKRETLDLETLSSGEKQCLAIARLLFHHPHHPPPSHSSSSATVVLLDEVTSAVDEETEEKLYEAIREDCLTFISVGHRSSIRRYHTHELQLRRDGSYSLVIL